jgi:hypothetical protein
MNGESMRRNFYSHFVAEEETAAWPSRLWSRKAKSIQTRDSFLYALKRSLEIRIHSALLRSTHRFRAIAKQSYRDWLGLEIKIRSKR